MTGRDVTSAILHYFDTLHLPRIINSAALALVPKVNYASSLNQLRPTSCCNIIYKSITKLLANRMKKVLPRIVSSCQSAFVPQRLLGDNVLLAQSLCSNYHLNSGEPKCAIKLGLRKAFDTTSWSFRRATLENMEFSAVFIDWVMTCITSCMLSVKINGALEGYFPARCGLRQGDPISPYLFVISMEVLTAYIKVTTTSPEFKYHWKSSSPAITHLVFADDILLFAKGEKKVYGDIYARGS